MAEAAEPVSAPEPVAAVDPPAPAPEPAAPESVDALPEWAQKLIMKTRTEAATNRTKAGSANEALAATRDAISKALGLAADDDPVAAAKTAAEERDAARQEARQTHIENAVLRMANKQGANPESLTDSRAFMRQLDAIDPTGDDFGAQVETAIQKALEANPALKAQGAAPVAPARSGGPVGGGAPVAAEYSEEWVHEMTVAGRYDEIAKASEEGRLSAVLSRQPED